MSQELTAFGHGDFKDKKAKELLGNKEQQTKNIKEFKAPWRWPPQKKHTHRVLWELTTPSDGDFKDKKTSELRAHQLVTKNKKNAKEFRAPW